MLIYQLLIRLVSFFAPIAGLFNAKFKQQLSGQKKSFTLINLDAHRPVVWMHVASLGEYEQGLPLLEKLKSERPDYQIALSFFSPSGYENVKAKAPVDALFYLPFDTKANAKKLVYLLKPTLALFVKYEIWPNYLQELERQRIPAVLMVARFYPDQWFFRYAFGKQQLHRFTKILCLNDTSAILAKSIVSPAKVFNTGDTRFDRVTAIAKSDIQLEWAEEFIAGRKCVIIGSSWEEEHILLATVLREFHDPTICFIVVPHKVDPKSIGTYRSQFAEPVALYSEHAFQSAHRILLVDRIGMLSSLYLYADLALVGGGFKTGLHNVLEPAIYSIPVLIGPNYHKFPEASALVEKGGVIAITNSDDLELYLQTLARQPRVLEELGIQNRLGIEESSGATDRIYDQIKTFL